MVSALLVDDEPVICEELNYLLEQEENINVLGKCYSGNEALEKIEKLKPDIVFLDIQMPGINGLDVAEKLNTFANPPYIVFVTAYKNYAFDGYKVNAIDYVLKPFDSDDIRKVLKKVNKIINNNANNNNFNNFENLINIIKSQKTDIKKICGDKNGKLEVLDPNDIIIVFSQNRLVYIKTYDDKYTTNLTLQQLEDELKSKQFFRCHRKYLVNLNKIKQVIPWFNGTYLLVLKDKDSTEISVSRSYIKDLKEILKF